jgi:hypothetical protein
VKKQAGTRVKIVATLADSPVSQQQSPSSSPPAVSPDHSGRGPRQNPKSTESDDQTSANHHTAVQSGGTDSMASVAQPMLVEMQQPSSVASASAEQTELRVVHRTPKPLSREKAPRRQSKRKVGKVCCLPASPLPSYLPIILPCAYTHEHKRVCIDLRHATRTHTRTQTITHVLPSMLCCWSARHDSTSYPVVNGVLDLAARSRRTLTNLALSHLPPSLCRQQPRPTSYRRHSSHRFQLMPRWQRFVHQPHVETPRRCMSDQTARSSPRPLNTQRCHPPTRQSTIP